jgi:hypothetical protein
MPTFAKGVGGSFGGIANSGITVKVTSATVSRTQRTYNKTGSGDTASTADAAKRITYSISGGRGWLKNSTANVYSSGNMASLSGSVTARTSKVVLVKSQSIRDVTAAEDAVPDVLFDISSAATTYFGSGFGYLEDDETPLADDFNGTPATFTIPLGVGTVAASTIISSVGQGIDLAGGGAFGANFRFQLIGAVTATGTIFAPETHTAAIDLDNGTTMGGTLILTRLQLDLDYQAAGNVPVYFDGVFSDTVTFTPDA